MKKTNITKENKWRKIAITFIWLFSVTLMMSVFLFTKTTYPSRIATKIGWGGV